MDLLDRCEAVLHLAALIGIPYSYLSPESYVDTNIKGTLNVVHSVAEVIAAIQAAAGTTLAVHSADTERPHEIPEALADISRATELLAWLPKWPLDAGIRAVLKGDRREPCPAAQ
jgi:nucleoside-diphosphate-sugar epimerase